MSSISDVDGYLRPIFTYAPINGTIPKNPKDHGIIEIKKLIPIEKNQQVYRGKGMYRKNTFHQIDQDKMEVSIFYGSDMFLKLSI